MTGMMMMLKTMGLNPEELMGAAEVAKGKLEQFETKQNELGNLIVQAFTRIDLKLNAIEQRLIEQNRRQIEGGNFVPEISDLAAAPAAGFHEHGSEGIAA